MSGLGLAACAAYYSIIGISTLFSGAALSVSFMALFLETGKIGLISFLYRYWEKCHKLLKIYLCISMFILISITSCGIGAMLLSAYQKSSLEYKANQDKVTMISGQKTYLNSRISQSQERIKTLNDLRATQEARLTEALTNAYLTRNPIQLKEIQDQTVQLIQSSDSDIKSEQQKVQSTMDDMAKIDQQVNELKFSSANKKDIRTFQFIADQFGTTLDNVAKWFILALIGVFDPLAVALILAYNVSTYKSPNDVITTSIKKEPITTVNPVIPSITKEIQNPSPSTPPAESVSPITSDLKRMFKL
jgi:hypothetical protein